VGLVLIAEPVEREEREYQEEGMTPLRTHFPRRYLGRVRFCVPVVSSSMKPVAVVVNVEFFQVTKFVQRVMLQVMSF